MLERLQQGFDASDDQVYEIHGLIDLADLDELIALDRPELKHPPAPGTTPVRLAHVKQPRDLFDEIRRNDILVHQPYESFAASFEAFVRAAARDPDVIAMKTAVYRTSGDSPLVPALIECAEDGKQSVCLVELKARFDEHRNIEWSRALEQAGVHVVYGFPDLKVHAKMTLVVRREGNALRRYVHVGTGNYHAVTARSYEDVSLYTADPEIADDVALLFNYLTGFGRPGALQEDPRRAVRAARSADRPHPRRRPGRRGRQGRPHPPQGERAHGRGDHRRALRGVPAGRADRDRGALDLHAPSGRAGAQRRHHASARSPAATSSTAGVFAFEAGDSAEFFLGSADLMTRNLDRRIEVLVPVERAATAPGADGGFRQRLCGQLLLLGAGAGRDLGAPLR